MYYYIGDYPSAMGIAQRGIVLAERQNDKEELAHYNNQLGFIYLKQEKPVESIKYYRQYLNLAQQAGTPALVADAYNCLADAYLLEKNYKTTLSYLFTALHLYKKLDKEVIANKTGVITKADRVSYTSYKISNAYKLQGQYELSLQYAKNGLSYTDGHHIPSYNKYDLARY